MTAIALQDVFVEQVPQMTRFLNFCFRGLDYEAREEAVQNALTLAWKTILPLAEQEQEPGILRSVLYYSVRSTRSGRMIQGSNARRAKDMIHYSQREGWDQLPVEELVGRTTPIPDAVAFRLDTPRFLATLTPRQRELAKDLAMGMTTKEVAEKHGVTPGAISQFRQRFKTLYDGFFSTPL